MNIKDRLSDEGDCGILRLIVVEEWKFLPTIRVAFGAWEKLTAACSCSCNTARLGDERWTHLAFTRSGSEEDAHAH